MSDKNLFSGIVNVKGQLLPAFKHLLTEKYYWDIEHNYDTLAVGIIEDNVSCGVLVYKGNDVTSISIEYIYVQKEYRRKGYANALLDYVVKQAEDLNLTVMAVFLNDPDEDELYELLDNNGYFDLGKMETRRYRADAETIEAMLKSLPKPKRMPESYCFYSAENELKNTFKSKQSPDFGLYLIKEDPLKVEDLCLFTLGADYEPNAAIFISRTEDELENEFELRYLWSSKGGEVNMLYLIEEVAARLLQEHGQDLVLWIDAITPESENLAARLLGNGSAAYEYYIASTY